MLRNQIKYAIRILLKDGIYSLLNVLGLTLGISVGIILFLYLQSEFSYDAHHEKANQIYRLSIHLKAQGADFNTSRTARELAPELKQELPEVLNYVRFNPYNNTLVTKQEGEEAPVKFYEDGIMEVDSTFLSVFTHQVLAGNAESCLSGPGKVVLSETMASKYFGEESPIGKTIRIGGNDNRQVSAVISDLPDNSHLKYSILLSELSERNRGEGEETAMQYSERFWNPNIYTYLLMPESYDPNQFSSSFESIFEKYFRPFADRIEGTATPRLQQLTEVHFGVDLANDEPIGNLNYVYAFTAIGLFLILLACINYMNMATARSMYRAGEIGVRKVLGKTRFGLFWSLLTESIVLAVVAMVFALVVCFVILNFTPFNSWIEKTLTLDLIGNLPLLFGVMMITLVVGLLSGVYPALYIPAVPVVSALKGTIITQKRGAIIRKVLITLQFVISIFVIITTILMGSQIDYMKKSDLGFDIENVVVVPLRGDFENEKIEAIKAEMEKHPSVVSTTTAYGVPGMDVGGQVFLTEQDGGGDMLQNSMFTIYCGKNYLKTTGYELIAGRDFLPGDADLNKGLLVNEAGVKALGWGDNAIGRKVRYFHGQRDMEIVGVVKDFNFESLHKAVEAMFILQVRDRGGYMQIRIKGNDIEASLDHMRSVITKFDEKNPFDYYFQDEEFNEQYRADQIQQQLISTLSYICIFISLMGLIGLSAFTVSQKAKEISIRKTLGGSLMHILYVFSKGYLILMLIAMVIAIPLADFMMVEWLSSFAYQMPQNWWLYVLPSLMVMACGLATVLLQTFKAARTNPVDGLRSE